jgi:succinate dehydrogenase / fumarate reductase cytochrome b subunit
MTSLVATLAEGLRYRGRGGQWSWILHRVSGLGTLFFLMFHVLDTATVYFLPEHYIDFIRIYRNPFMMLGEIVLVACVLYHGLNGLRIALFDLRPQLWTQENQARSVWYVAVAFLVLFIPVAVIMGGHVLAGLGGGA